MTSTNFSDKSFSDRVHQHLTEVKASADRSLADIDAARSQAAASLMARHAQAQAVMEARRRDIESANAKVKAALDAKKAETDAAVADLKVKRDVQRLEHRAQLALAHLDRLEELLTELHRIWQLGAHKRASPPREVRPRSSISTRAQVTATSTSGSTTRSNA